MLSLPKSLCKSLDQKFKNFWWGFPSGKMHNLTLKGWSSICSSKAKGGQGLRKMAPTNTAPITKLGWRFISQPNSLWVSTLTRTYVKNEDFWELTPSPTNSWFWKGLLKTRSILKQSLCNQIYNGSSTKIWQDAWIDPYYPWLQATTNFYCNLPRCYVNCEQPFQ